MNKCLSKPSEDDTWVNSTNPYSNPVFICPPPLPYDKVRVSSDLQTLQVWVNLTWFVLLGKAQSLLYLPIIVFSHKHEIKKRWDFLFCFFVRRKRRYSVFMMAYVLNRWMDIRPILINQGATLTSVSAPFCLYLT